MPDVDDDRQPDPEWTNVIMHRRTERPSFSLLPATHVNTVLVGDNLPELGCKEKRNKGGQ